MTQVTEEQVGSHLVLPSVVGAGETFLLGRRKTRLSWLILVPGSHREDGFMHKQQDHMTYNAGDFGTSVLLLFMVLKQPVTLLSPILFGRTF